MNSIYKPEVNERVRDREGDEGRVKSSHDLHNIEVEFDNGGFGLFCLVEGCPERHYGDVLEPID